MALLLMLITDRLRRPGGESHGAERRRVDETPMPAALAVSAARPARDEVAVSDENLIRRAQTDPRAFGPLYERYHNHVYRYCYTRLGSREAAEDVTADTFLRGLAKLHRLRHDSVLLAWLYTLARHAVADYYHRQRPAQAWDEVAEVAHGSDPGRPALDRLALAQALPQLPDLQRAALELQLAGWSIAESADALGKTEAAIKMARYRAVERLQQLLKTE